MLRVQQDGPVLRLTLDRPEVRNALNDELIAALTEQFSAIGDLSKQSEIRNAKSAIRAVVLSGEGKGFCAGGDLDWMRRAAAYTEEENYQDALKVAALFRSIAYCPAIVIARVHGAAFGGGSGIVAASDVAVCEPDSKFAFSEVKLGLVPATISPYVIGKIGAGNARALFSTGEAFGADRALRIGLVHEVAPVEALDIAVEAKIQAVLEAGPNAAAAAKRVTMEPFAGSEEAARALAKARASEEGKEGVNAFLEKRKANWVPTE